jgi:hypothetical protein
VLADAALDAARSTGSVHDNWHRNFSAAHIMAAANIILAPVVFSKKADAVCALTSMVAERRRRVV